MKKIELTQNQYALVDDEDFDKLNQWKWYATYQPCVKSFYAVRHLRGNKNSKRQSILMHRIIMDTPRNMQTDHINHDTLDNRKQNLRICTVGQNNSNRINHKNFTSKYKGVYSDKRNKNLRWIAQIRINTKAVYLGAFKSEIQAAKAYNKKARELFGEYALLNKIKKGVK